LKDNDRVVGLGQGDDQAWLCFITTDAQLLRFQADGVRPQGRAAGGMAGIKLAPRQRVLFFGVIQDATDAQVASVASSGALEGLDPGSGKVSLFEAFPPKGRATGGVRCQRFLRGQDHLVRAWAGPSPARAVAAGGQPVALPELDPRRDGSGTRLSGAISGFG
jgi:DNA gyrase subunit A